MIPTIFVGNFTLRLHLPIFTSTSGKVEVIFYFIFLYGEFVFLFFLGLLQLTRDFSFINRFLVNLVVSLDMSSMTSFLLLFRTDNLIVLLIFFQFW